MRKFRFPFPGRTFIGGGALAALGLVGGCDLAETQPDDRSASTAMSVHESSLEVSAGHASSRSDGTLELQDGVAVYFDGSITLLAKRVTVRDGQPWQLYGFTLSHPGGILTGDRGTFDPESLTYTAEGSVSYSVDANADAE